MGTGYRFKKLMGVLQCKLLPYLNLPPPRNFVVIIGAMKCGTTSLFSLLSQHPVICAADIKEVDFFCDPERFRHGLRAYQRHWGRWFPLTHRYALEASTNYSKREEFPNVPARMSSFDCRFRLIYIMRDPFERIESQYTHAERHDAYWRVSESPDEPVSRKAISLSRYAYQLDAYKQEFDPKNILLLAFEDLANSPEALLRRICSFLSIDETFEFSRVNHVANRNAGWLRKDGTVIEHNVRLTDQQRDFVRTELAEDMRRLKDEYGFDPSRWGF